MYTKLTFTNSSILTASNCNQMEENILETRVANIGSGPPNSAELLAGNLWTKTASAEWNVNIINNSLDWLPFATVDTANNAARLNTAQMVSDGDGGPYISSEALIVNSIVGQNSFHKVGPTASGSYDIVWTPLSEIPRTIDWIRLRIDYTYVTTGTDVAISNLLQAWTYNASRGAVGNDAVIASVGQQTVNVTSFKRGSHTSTARIAVNSDNAFEISQSFSISQPSGQCFLIGYGYNR